MARFFVEPSQIKGTRLTITGEDAHHIYHVLRMGKGEFIEVACGDGYQLVAQLEGLSSDLITGTIVQKYPSYQEPPVETILYQALPKGDKFDFVIQKAVELGVRAIIPFVSQYTIVKLDPKKEEKKLKRWQRIAVEASKQCQRDLIPDVLNCINYSDVVKKIEGREEGDLYLLPYEHEEMNGLTQLASLRPKRISIIIGSEGGFSSEEVEQAKRAGARVISLGPRILRTETAGLVALTLAGYLWGDLGGKR